MWQGDNQASGCNEGHAPKGQAAVEDGVLDRGWMQKGVKECPGPSGLARKETKHTPGNGGHVPHGCELGT